MPELADQPDPVLVQLDRLLEDDQLYGLVRHDLARRYRLTPVHGRHSTPAEAILRLRVVQHLSACSSAETVERVADSPVLRWFCRVYCHQVPTKATLLRWAATIHPAHGAGARRPGDAAGQAGQGDAGAQAAGG